MSPAIAVALAVGVMSMLAPSALVDDVAEIRSFTAAVLR
jgi:hypothetical protein